VIGFLNIVDGTEAGVELKQSRGGGLRCNCVARNGEEGLEVEDGKQHEIRANLVTRNAEEGMEIEGTNRSVVAGNTVRENGRDGIELERAARNQVTGNAVVANGSIGSRDSGIEVERSERNLIDGNTIRDNADGLTDLARLPGGQRPLTGSDADPGRPRVVRVEASARDVWKDALELVSAGLIRPESVPPVHDVDASDFGARNSARTAFDEPDRVWIVPSSPATASATMRTASSTSSAARRATTATPATTCRSPDGQRHPHYTLTRRTRGRYKPVPAAPPWPTTRSKGRANAASRP